MGMAASQARLLSITSRLSDNELRSQLINNQKIRLATESSKASERYVAALNDTKMMYSAYDVKGNPLNKELTFANLTAYSSYNNQYGLRNLSGQILVSEEDAFNMENAKYQDDVGNDHYDLEEFLKSYNLEKGTTFFDKISTEMIDACLGLDTDAGKTSGLTGEDLKAMYLGGEDTKGTVHEGYDNILSGTEYNTKFEPLFTEYTNSYEVYKKEMAKYAEEYNKVELKLEQLKADINSASGQGTLARYYDQFISKINQAAGMGLDGDPFFTDQAELVEKNKNLEAPMSTVRSGTTVTVAGIFKFTPPMSVTPIPDDDGVMPEGTFVYAGSDTNNYKVNQIFTNDAGDSEKITYYIPKTSGSAYIIQTYDETDYKSTLISLIDNFIKNSPDHYDYSKFTLPGGSAAEKARENFNTAAQALYEYMFGAGKSPDDKSEYQKLNDLEYIFDKKAQHTPGFASVLDVLILDAVFNELGDPVVTWIDTTNPNEDATAKAQWYTNLFNRMLNVTTTEDDKGTITEEVKTNYQVLENGLATSAEWLQFALESGLVSMEQVDQSNNWCSTLYTNCSDITETTDTTEATIAEAEYNSTMAKIEAKDKQFDMQLKNIDTEHESLQTEYDSIKSVLDKNIERNFKMYSA